MPRTAVTQFEIQECSGFQTKDANELESRKQIEI